MASTKEIQRRIKGVRSTGKITRAMEMISAVKMRKAVEAVTNVRPYAKAVLVVLRQMTTVEHMEHPFFVPRPVKKALYIVVASNRGLCGGFNSQVYKRLRAVREEDTDREALYITIGKKADAIARRIIAAPVGGGGEIIASFPDILTIPSAENVRPVARMLVEKYLSGEIDRAVVAYTDFVSVMTQTTKVRVLLPVVEKDVLKEIHEMDPHAPIEVDALHAEYVIEPASEEMLERLILQLLTMEIYHAVFESNASQEAARMMAMRNATDAAKEMVADLTLSFNQLRQAKITQEIAELSAGKAALET